MKKMKNNGNIERISPINENCFFGYYDLQTWNEKGNKHLFHKVKRMDLMPKEGDKAEICVYNRQNNSYEVIDETEAWCFQQGSLLQWLGENSNEDVIYNVKINHENHSGDLEARYQAKIKSTITGKERFLDRPIANIDKSGRYGLSINFSRMYDYRPGYGYVGLADPNRNIERPSNDGVYLLDLQEGNSKLILSLEQIGEFLDASEALCNEGKLLINHINFNTDGSRFVMLVRSFKRSADPLNPWITAVVTANKDGSGMHLLNNYVYASHYFWKDASSLLIYARNNEGNQLYELKDQTDEYKVLNQNFFKADGHCSYSPNREWVLYDSYPDADGYKDLYLYHLEKGSGVTLGKFYSTPVSQSDLRCDLHPRWLNTMESRRSTIISFDSTHEGYRGVYLMDIEKVMEEFYE